MQLTITLMSKKYEIEKDIIVNSQQKIVETIKIFGRSGSDSAYIGQSISDTFLEDKTLAADRENL